VERDAHRAVARSYPEMQLFPKSKLASGQVFLFLAERGTDRKRIAKRFAGATVTAVSYRLFEIHMPG
jgi:hypothetical protein